MFPFRFVRALTGALAFLSAVATLAAQEAPVYGRTQSIEESHSQAERQAEQTVSLSPEKLIDLLQKEPGLLLEVKKLLFRKAFEQGRILEARDLTDEALFRLLREDDTIRVLATQEVTKRFYIRALPTREERKREMDTGDSMRTTRSVEKSSTAQNREDQYWSDHERIEVSPSTSEPAHEPPYDPRYSPQPQYYPPYGPTSPPMSPGAEPQPEIDSRRTLEQAEMQDSDDLDGTPMDSGSSGPMERVSPEDLPGLIRARSEQPTSNGAGSMSQPFTLDAGRPPSYPLPTQGESPGMRAGTLQDQNLPNQRASLDTHGDRRLLRPMPHPDHALLRHRVNPYADIPSLYDLYAQYGARSPQPVRFGDDIFRNGSGNLDQLPMDLPLAWITCSARATGSALISRVGCRSGCAESSIPRAGLRCLSRAPSPYRGARSAMFSGWYKLRCRDSTAMWKPTFRWRDYEPYASTWSETSSGRVPTTSARCRRR